MQKIKNLFSKIFNKETFLYAVFGVLTTLLNIFMFKWLLMLKVEYKIANLFTLVVVKLTAYICNKNFVFKSKCPNFKALLAEFWRFVYARGATMILEYFGLILMVELLGINKLISKIFMTILVVILNYIIGKKHVFQDGDNKK